MSNFYAVSCTSSEPPELSSIFELLVKIRDTLIGIEHEEEEERLRLVSGRNFFPLAMEYFISIT